MRNILVLLAGLVAFTACGVNKRKKVEKQEIELIKSPELNKNWEYFSAKSSVEFDGMGQSLSGMISWRMKKDSIIWFSATAVLGLQVAKGVITKDSIWLLNILNREYYAMGIGDAKKILGADVELSHLQNALIGGALFNKPTNYTCDSSGCFGKFDDFTNTLKISNENTIAQSELLKVGNTSSLNFIYTNKLELSKYWVPQTIEIKGQSVQKKIHAILVYKTANDNIIPSFPFDIPNGYTKL